MSSRESRATRPQPLVSVIVPAYLAARYIADTIESILAQTFTDYEIIVVNDGSPDTEELERMLEPYRHRIVYLVQQNRGQGGARNTGLRASRGTLVAFLDQDDQWEPEFLSFQTGVMQADPDLAVHYADAVIFGDVPRKGRRIMEFTPSRGEATFHRLIRRECTVLNCAAISRREAVLRAGLFNESLRYGEDIDLWLRIARQGGRIGYQTRVIARCRLRGDSVSADVERMTEGYLRVLGEIRQSPNLQLGDIQVLDRQIASENASLDLIKGHKALQRGDVGTALEYLGKANAFFRKPKIGASLLLLRMVPNLFLSLYRFSH